MSDIKQTFTNNSFHMESENVRVVRVYELSSNAAQG